MSLSRMSRPGACLIGATNPDSPYHWLKKDYLDRANELDIFDVSFNLDDNTSLSAEYKSAIRKEYTGLWYKRYIEGLWVAAEGAIYDFFDEKVHVKDVSGISPMRYYLSIDYGTVNPFAALLLGFHPRANPRIWIAKEWVWDSREKGYQLTDGEYADEILRQFDCSRITSCVVDPSAASFKRELRKRGANFSIRDADNDVNNGLRRTATLFSRGDLVIDPTCEHTIKEMYSYAWDEKHAAITGDERPKKVNDHLMDSLRYAIYTLFRIDAALERASS